MNIFKIGESKLKAVTDWIANEAREDKWFIELYFSNKTITRNQLEDSLVQKYISFTQEFSNLKSLTERLAFKDSNKEYFEFTSPVINLKKEKELVFTFSFLPNPGDPKQLEEYNQWFIKRSLEYLKLNKPSKNGLTYTTFEELKERFLFLKDRTPLLDKFIELEEQRVRNLCNKSFPNLFDTLHSYRIKAFDVDLTTSVFDQRLWSDLYVWPYVEYSIQLKVYKQSTLEEQLKHRENQDKPTKQKSLRPNKKDYTILELFKGNKSNLNLFITILKTRGYFTESGKWNAQIQSGEFLPIVEYLANNNIIIEVSKAMLWRIFEKEFGPIMSERNFRVTNHYFILDEALKKALSSLVKAS